MKLYAWFLEPLQLHHSIMSKIVDKGDVSVSITDREKPLTTSSSSNNNSNSNNKSSSSGSSSSSNDHHINSNMTVRTNKYVLPSHRSESADVGSSWRRDGINLEFHNIRFSIKRWSLGCAIKGNDIFVSSRVILIVSK